MLSEEEKQVIEELKEDIKNMEENEEIIHIPLFKYEAKILLNLIEKLQKENIDKQKEADNYISKEKIREKIEKLEKAIIKTKNKLKYNEVKYNYIRKARLKAFITKMNEFRKYLKELLDEKN